MLEQTVLIQIVSTSFKADHSSVPLGGTAHSELAFLALTPIRQANPRKNKQPSEQWREVLKIKGEERKGKRKQTNGKEKQGLSDQLQLACASFETKKRVRLSSNAVPGGGGGGLNSFVCN